MSHSSSISSQAMHQSLTIYALTDSYSSFLQLLSIYPWTIRTYSKRTQPVEALPAALPAFLPASVHASPLAVTGACAITHPSVHLLINQDLPRDLRGPISASR